MVTVVGRIVTSTCRCCGLELPVSVVFLGNVRVQVCDFCIEFLNEEASR